MNVEKTKVIIHCRECKVMYEGYKITFSDGVPMAFLCNDCTDNLAEILKKKIND